MPGSDETVGVAQYPVREGAFYPALVSGVDEDGNEVAGIRMPDVSVPVATHSGWNPRDPSTGAPEQIVPMNGMTLYFARSVDEREVGDERPAIDERYRDRDDYREQVTRAAQALVASRYLLAEDVGVVVSAALVRFDDAMATDPALVINDR